MPDEIKKIISALRMSLLPEFNLEIIVLTTDDEGEAS